MKLRLAIIIAAFFAVFAPALPALAQDDDSVANTPVLNSSLRGLAPADEYFGRYNLSVLGIANNIRDAGTRIETGGDVHAMITGPLMYATDAIKAWEQQFPSDPWIAKDLLALEATYLKVPTSECYRLASQTAEWLRSDYPDTLYAAQGRKQLADNAPRQAPQPVMLPPVVVQAPVIVQQPVVYRQTIPSYATPWERYASLRAVYYR